MAIAYRTSYRLGSRRGILSRTYTGPKAWIAIGVDLVLAAIFAIVGLVLGVLLWALRLVWELTKAAIRFVLAVALSPRRAYRSMCRPAGPLAERKKPILAGFQDF